MTTYRFGKRPARRDYRTLRFGDYLRAEALAPPPRSYNVLTPVYKHLHTRQPAVLFPLDGNDVIGDCTIAAVAHAATVFRGLVGQRSVMPAEDVKRLYFQLSGGEDTGLVLLDVLNYWRKNVVAQDQLLAYASVSPANHSNVKQAIHLFGGVYLGFQVQRQAIPDFHARRPWTPGKLTQEGHAVFAVGYDAAGVTVLTWGNTQRGTWAWWDETVDEAFALLPPQAQQPGFAPGFDFAQLQADLAQVTG
jgi:hypothetical protein